ncbi:MAG TPA: L,D-transpeptidase [Gemmatimonas sp.]|nr:L,D-transpeptidase [Gemmatimonas sp.]
MYGFRAARRTLVAGAALLSVACGDASSRDRLEGASTGSTPPAPPAASATVPGAGPSDSVLGGFSDSAGQAATRPVAVVRVEIDLTARELHLYRGDSMVATHPVAVGSAEWPTRTGEWNITQVVWNPEWIPPDESWAEEREPRKSGDPKNPLGHAQLVYDMPRTIHGTNDPTSIGKAVSHGSIRVKNEVAMTLARLLMEETGVVKDEAWYTAARTDRKTKQIVDLPQLVPIRVF